MLAQAHPHMRNHALTCMHMHTCTHTITQKHTAKKAHSIHIPTLPMPTLVYNPPGTQLRCGTASARGTYE